MTSFSSGLAINILNQSWAGHLQYFSLPLTNDKSSSDLKGNPNALINRITMERIGSLVHTSPLISYLLLLLKFKLDTTCFIDKLRGCLHKLICRTYLLTEDLDTCEKDSVSLLRVTASSVAGFKLKIKKHMQLFFRKLQHTRVMTW